MVLGDLFLSEIGFAVFRLHGIFSSKVQLAARVDLVFTSQWERVAHYH